MPHEKSKPKTPRYAQKYPFTALYLAFAASIPGATPLPVTTVRICATTRAFLLLRPSPTARNSCSHRSSSPVSGALTSSLPRRPTPPSAESSTEATSRSNSCLRADAGWAREK